MMYAMTDTSAPLKKLLRKACERSHERYGRKINFYYTGDSFPAISITGSACALNCKHCEGTLISRLPSATTPEEVLKLCTGFHEAGAAGVLITGGCTAGGKVPLTGFLDAIRKVREQTTLKVIAHTGITGYGEAREIKDAGIDGVCIDVVGSGKTTEEIYGIRITEGDYERTLKAFERAGMGCIAPHVCVGLHNGRLFHETKALEIISCIKPRNVVVIGLTDVVGTPMEGVKIMPEDVARILCLARLRFPESYVSLGCAHGKGGVREEIEKLAVKAGVNSIALPTASAYREARRLGLEAREFGACCALTPEELG